MNDHSPAPAPTRAAATKAGKGYPHAVVVLLMLAYACNAADRSIVSIIGQAMKADLSLSDTELGLLSGTAFALLYGLSGLPLARLAERANRVTLIAVAMVAWSGLTALCGAAGSFAQLLLIRVGVGIGEAGCTPAAHSLISDLVPPARRATALSVYSCGISLGYIFGALAGGWVAQHHGWRAACVVVGLPGIAMALLLKRCVHDPRAHAPPTAPPARIDWRHELGELRAVGRALLRCAPVRHVLLGLTLASFASYGIYAFVPAYLNRAYGLDYHTVGIVAALTGGLAVGAGILLGGLVCDALATRSGRWYALVPATGLALACPLYGLAFGQADWHAAAWLLAAAGFLQYLALGPTFALLQNVVAPGQRATATALLYTVLNVVALGGGSFATGRLIDVFAEHGYRPSAPTAAPLEGQVSSGSATNAASFRAACPGGRARVAGDASGEANCRRTLARASRSGLLAMLFFYAWACLHYLLGTRGLHAVLRDARAAAG